MLQAGVSIEVVSAMLGHSDVRVTQAVYAHWGVEFLRDAAAVLGGDGGRLVASLIELLTRAQRRTGVGWLRVNRTRNEAETG